MRDLISYRVWNDGGLFYWDARTESGFRIGFGAHSDALQARVEALAYSTRYASIKEIDAVERRASAERLRSASADLLAIHRLRQMTDEHGRGLLATRNLSRRLIARSRDSLRTARELLARDR